MALLSDGLSGLAALSAGTRTPFEQLDKLGGDLLRDHPISADRARILSTLAYISAQGGTGRSAKTAEYARRALDAGVADRSERMQLYLYWGDALEVLPNTKKEIVAKIFVKGLGEVASTSLPDNPPPLPGVMRFEAVQLGVGSPGYAQAVAEAIKEHNRQIREREKAVEIGDLVRARSSLVRQLLWLYRASGDPVSEIRKVAMGVPLDPKAAQFVLGILQKTINTQRSQHKGSGSKAGN